MCIGTNMLGTVLQKGTVVTKKLVGGSKKLEVHVQ